MREGIRDVLLAASVILAAIQAWLVWQSRTTLASNTASQSVLHPIGGPILVASLLIVAGILNIVPLVLRRHFSRSTKTTPKEHVYVGPRGMSTWIIGDQAHAHIVIFSAHDTELRYLRVRISKGDEHIVLESSDPTRISAFTPTEKEIRRSLTPDELQRIGDHLNFLVDGTAKFSDGLELPFKFPSIAMR